MIAQMNVMINLNDRHHRHFCTTFFVSKTKYPKQIGLFAAQTFYCLIHWLLKHTSPLRMHHLFMLCRIKAISPCSRLLSIILSGMHQEESPTQCIIDQQISLGWTEGYKNYIYIFFLLISGTATWRSGSRRLLNTAGIFFVASSCWSVTTERMKERTQ